MRWSIFVTAGVLFAFAPALAGRAMAQNHLTGHGECDQPHAFLVDRPDCLGYNPYYVPPGSATPLGFRTKSDGDANSSVRGGRVLRSR